MPMKPTLSRLTEIMEARRRVSILPRFGLDEYRQLVSSLPPPTDHQIRAFALFVSEARSWYKHLPLLPPGVPFHFFIDPCSGMDCIILGNGRVTYRDRTTDTPRFHYTWMTTAEYRSRFCWLAFGAAAGREVSVIRGNISQLPVQASAPRQKDVEEVTEVRPINEVRLSIHTAEGEEFQLPQEVLDAGATLLTGVIHSRAGAVAALWLGRNPDEHQWLLWPQETGGSETARTIAGRCRQIGRQNLPREDPELDRLLTPERRRLQEQMVFAINRVVALLYQDSERSA
jgi:hypothetical protein